MDSEPRGPSTHVTRPTKKKTNTKWKLAFHTGRDIKTVLECGSEYSGLHQTLVPQRKCIQVVWCLLEGRKKDAGYGFKTRDMVPLRGQARTRQRKSPLVMSLERFLCCLMMSWDIFLHFDVAAKSVLGWDTRWFLSVYDIRRSLNDVPINRVLVSWLCCVGMMCQRFPVSIYLFTTPPCSERPLPLDWVVWPVDWTRDREV